MICLKGLKAKCRELRACMAFNSEGVLKSQVREQTKWEDVAFFKASDQGLYIAEVDLCEADLHDCAKYAVCIPICE